MTYDDQLDNFDSELDRLAGLSRTTEGETRTYTKAGINLHTLMETVAHDRDNGLLSADQKERFNAQTKRLLHEVFGIKL